MRAEHRHKLKTNELAEWLSNLPQWTRENLRMVIYVSVVILAVAGSYFYLKYEKGVVSVQRQLRLTERLTELASSRRRILYAQAQGIDMSYMLIQVANNLRSVARNFGDDQMAALALIKRGQALRTELHYHSGNPTTEEIEDAISRAKASYTEALQKCSSNPSLAAMAKFGLGLCEEELGNFTAAEQVYRDIVTNPDFEFVVAVASARERLEAMADYKEKISFKPAAPAEKPKAAGPIPERTKAMQPQVTINRPSPTATDTNLLTPQDIETVEP